jgi:hypothetical protein
MVVVAKLIGADVLEMSRWEDRWALTSDDAEIGRICFDWGVTLTVSSGDSQIDVRVEQPILYTDSSGASYQLAADGDPSDLAPLLQIGRQPVARLDAFADGHLELELRRGDALTVASSDDFEAWEIVSPRGFRLVSVPGGSVTAWSASDS